MGVYFTKTGNASRPEIGLPSRTLIGKASKSALWPAFGRRRADVEVFPSLNPAEIPPGSPVSGPEAILCNIGSVTKRFVIFHNSYVCEACRRYFSRKPDCCPGSNIVWHRVPPPRWPTSRPFLTAPCTVNQISNKKFVTSLVRSTNVFSSRCYAIVLPSRKSGFSFGRDHI